MDVAPDVDEALRNPKRLAICSFAAVIETLTRMA